MPLQQKHDQDVIEIRGYPRHIATKTDFENLIAMPEFRDRAIADLKAIYDLDDAKVTRATTPIDEKDPESDWNTEVIKNPMPIWKQKGFASRKAVSDMITKATSTNAKEV